MRKTLLSGCLPGTDTNQPDQVQKLAIDFEISDIILYRQRTSHDADKPAR